MKIKHFLLLCGSFLFAIAVAYAAGLRSTWLNNEATNYLPLQSQHHKDQLTSSMRDALISALAKRSRNHESRIRALAVADAPYPKLEASQMDFESYLSDRNGSKLKSGMWNQVLNGFSLVANNHEQRIRCLEDGSCLPKPATYHCVGEYEYIRKRCYDSKIGSYKLGCLTRYPTDINWERQRRAWTPWFPNDTIPLQECRRKDLNDWRRENMHGFSYQFIGTTPPRFDSYSRFENDIQRLLCYRSDIIDQDSPEFNETLTDPGLPPDSFYTFSSDELIRIGNEYCEYKMEDLCNQRNSADNCNADNLCRWSEERHKVSCSSFSESSCKLQPGCRREKQ